MADLLHRRILITRARDDCVAWARQLEARGAVPVIFPCIECRTIETKGLKNRLRCELPRADWLAFTSRRGVAALANLVRAPLSRDLKVAVVGQATGRAARSLLGRVDLESELSTAAGLAEQMNASIGGGARILVAVAENAGTTLESSLRSAGNICTRLDVYRTLPKTPQTPKHRLSALGVGKILLASPSAVTGLVSQLDWDAEPEVFTIGPSTTKAAQAAGLRVTREAPRPSLEGFLEILKCPT